MQIIKTILLYSLTLAIGLGISIGAQYGYRWYSQTPMIIETDTRAHFAEADTAIVLHTTSWCPYCKKAKAFLDSHHIAYTIVISSQGNQRLPTFIEALVMRVFQKSCSTIKSLMALINPYSLKS